MSNLFKRVDALEKQQEYTLTKQTMENNIAKWKPLLDKNKFIINIWDVLCHKYRVFNFEHLVSTYGSSFSLSEMLILIRWLKIWNKHNKKEIIYKL